MEKNPSSSASTKVPPRSSSTGPPPGESKAKSGERPFPGGMSRLSRGLLGLAVEAEGAPVYQG